MKRFVKVAGMPREEWLTWRRKGIGGSDAAALIGMSPSSSAYKVYLDKLGKLPESEQTEAQRIGNDLEEYVAQRFTEKTGLHVQKPEYMYCHPEHPWMLADFDRLIVEEPAGLECKVVNPYTKTDYEGNSIPPHFYVQCQHYMSVSGFDHWYLGILVLGVGFYHFRIERNETDIEYLISEEESFWSNNVMANEPPPPDGADTTTEAISAAFPTDSGIEIALFDMEDTAATIFNLKDTATKQKAQLQEAENKIKAQMESAESAYIPGYKATWKTTTRKAFDQKKFKTDYPDLYEQYLRETTSRKFILTKEKEQDNE